MDAIPSSDGTRSAEPGTARCGVVDLGSNSVRLVVFEGRGRNPSVIFNEKAVLGLGRGLQATGRLNEAAVEQALPVLERYGAVARAMRAEPLEVLATAAKGRSDTRLADAPGSFSNAARLPLISRAHRSRAASRGST